jgi:hypothetical protein
MLPLVVRAEVRADKIDIQIAFPIDLPRGAITFILEEVRVRLVNSTRKLSFVHLLILI